ncbi:Glutathione s-transferase [Thalictrum thalictroides]|uniref:glutathione transferase n=1 Tax=Thalictrum thalictroides TaxID=46969 RepID=A0A7J6VRJ2_THATH|nr:Glutathione s-transferase [Thalictrum thalictroides]
MGLKVYGAGMSTCTARVLTVLLEKEAEYELVPINLAVGEHKQPAYLAKHPFGQIPVLEDDDLTLFGKFIISPAGLVFLYVIKC